MSNAPTVSVPTPASDVRVGDLLLLCGDEEHRVVELAYSDFTSRYFFTTEKTDGTRGTFDHIVPARCSVYRVVE